MDKRIGTRNRDGSVTFPEVTLSGAAYTPPPTTMQGINAEHFVVLDIFPPQGFDPEKALVEVRATLKPPSVEKKIGLEKAGE